MESNSAAVESQGDVMRRDTLKIEASASRSYTLPRNMTHPL